MDLRPHGVVEEPSDLFTRWLFGHVVPITWQQRFRDGGHARNLVDNLVSLSTITMLQHVPRFLDSRKYTRIVPYSKAHEQCNLHITDLCTVLDEDNTAEKEEYGEILTTGNVLVFVHGGAWGSGKPWMYQLSAAGLARTLKARFLVLVEYPVYPLSNILEQRNCVCSAMRMIRSIDLASLFAAPIPMSTHIPTPMNSAPNRLILSGHSSGANICALALLRACGDGIMLCDAYVSLSGVFDICKHYEFEKSRGVHIMSPMGAAAGRDVGQFWEVSPTLLLQQLPHPTSHISNFFPPCLLLHGTLDTTVPMTSSMDMATELSKHSVHVHTSFPPIDHVHPMLELLQDPSESIAATGEGGGEGEVRAAVKRWYSSAMESKHTKTLLKSNL